MNVEYKQNDVLVAVDGIQHGFFTKNGGVSKGVYSSLNCSPSSDDLAENVIENRKRVMTALGSVFDAKLFGLYQIHSTKVYTITKATDNEVFPKGDAMVSNEKGIFLSVLGADCTPVLFADRAGKVIGAAHAGWKGAVSGIVEEVVLKMCELGAKREDIVACIGPTIHQASYEVQQDFLDQLNLLSSFPAEEFVNNDGGKFTFDLPNYLLKQCDLSGIHADDIGLDTYALKETFFSYRRNTHQQLKDYGRQISVIGLI